MPISRDQVKPRRLSLTSAYSGKRLDFLPDDHVCAANLNGGTRSVDSHHTSADQEENKSCSMVAIQFKNGIVRNGQRRSKLAIE